MLTARFKGEFVLLLLEFPALVTSASKEVCNGRFNDELVSLLLALATLGEDSVVGDLTIASFVAASLL